MGCIRFTIHSNINKIEKIVCSSNNLFISFLIFKLLLFSVQLTIKLQFASILDIFCINITYFRKRSSDIAISFNLVYFKVRDMRNIVFNSSLLLFRLY